MISPAGDMPGDSSAESGPPIPSAPPAKPPAGSGVSGWFVSFTFYFLSSLRINRNSASPGCRDGLVLEEKSHRPGSATLSGPFQGSQPYNPADDYLEVPLQPAKRIGSVQMIILLSLTGFEVSIRTARFHDLESALQSIVRVDRPSLDVLDYAYRDDPLPQGSPHRAGTFHQERTIASCSGIDVRNAPGPL